MFQPVNNSAYFCRSSELAAMCVFIVYLCLIVMYFVGSKFDTCIANLFTDELVATGFDDVRLCLYSRVSFSI